MPPLHLTEGFVPSDPRICWGGLPQCLPPTGRADYSLHCRDTAQWRETVFANLLTSLILPASFFLSKGDLIPRHQQVFSTNQYFSGVKIPDPEDMVSDLIWKAPGKSGQRLPGVWMVNDSLSMGSCRANWMLVVTHLPQPRGPFCTGKWVSTWKRKVGQIGKQTLAFSENLEVAESRG